MKIETLKLAHGYTAEVHTDESPQNPFTEWDCEPPLAVLYDGRLTAYGLEMSDILRHVPAEMWESRAGKRALAAATPFTLAEIRAEMRGYYGDSTFREALESMIGEMRDSDADFIETMESLARAAGIPCHGGTSTGYSQGDCARVLAVALPEWAEKVGAPTDSLADQCKHACELYGHWAWGDVYGVSEIRRPDGTEAPSGSCWGFYGSDHGKSGLMEHCAETVKHDRRTRKEAATARRAYLKRERAAAWEAACRDIITA